MPEGIPAWVSVDCRRRFHAGSSIGMGFGREPVRSPGPDPCRDAPRHAFSPPADEKPVPEEPPARVLDDLGRPCSLKPVPRRPSARVRAARTRPAEVRPQPPQGRPTQGRPAYSPAPAPPFSDPYTSTSAFRRRYTASLSLASSLWRRALTLGSRSARLA